MKMAVLSTATINALLAPASVTNFNVAFSEAVDATSARMVHISLMESHDIANVDTAAINTQNQYVVRDRCVTPMAIAIGAAQ